MLYNIFKNNSIHILNAYPSLFLDTLSISNQTVLPVHIDLEIQYPFIISETKMSMCIQALSSEEITVSFDPTFITDKYSVVIEKQLKLVCRDNPHMVIIYFELILMLKVFSLHSLHQECSELK